MASIDSAAISKRFVTLRSRASAKHDLPAEVKLGDAAMAGGQLEQVSTLDQFSDEFKPLIHSFEAPPSSCGYFAMANGLLLAHLLPRKKIGRADLEPIIIALQDQSKVVTQVSRAMAYISKARRAFIAERAADFKDKELQRRYMSDWVANYEISDFLRSQASQAEKDGFPKNLFFFRYNQMPEIDDAKHEELARLEEERCFGGRLLGSAGDKATCELEPGASRFIVEQFLPTRDLLRPSDWALASSASTSTRESPDVFIVDVNGHFVAAAAMYIEEEGEASCSESMPTLLVINTTHGNYLDRPALTYLFDLAFCEQS
eukprot:TRINITY_DN10368_c0_g4_i1.p1 TRINITY_DN10368_c0_g4~~TRINITY_DN10368_c0_g4_i1.p1  ORF type:complete len:317 (-),score=58.27 TRINITY_DN10368_c0_g4_i1:82-1032(-)